MIFMATVKTRKQGNALVITLEKSLNVKEGQEFYSIQQTNGTIALIPKATDIYANVRENEYKDMDTDNLAHGYSGDEIDG